MTATGNAGESSPLNGPAISADGAYVAFTSGATDHISGQIDANFGDDVFLWERATGAITLVSRASGSAVTAGNAPSFLPSISADGRYIAFQSYAANLVPGQTDTNNDADVFLYDRVSGTTTLVSHVPGSATATGPGFSSQPFISADGSAIAFGNYNPNLVAGQVDGNANSDVFLYDRLSGTNRLLSHTAGSALMAGNGGSGFAQISADGSTVSFNGFASDLVAGDYNLHLDTFVHGRPGLDFHTLTPCRLLDTRTPQDGPALVSGITKILVANGACGIPANASALALNVTVTQGSGGGHLTLSPGDFLLAPNTSTINFQAGQTRANNAVVSLAAEGSLAIRPAVTGGGTVHVIVDVTGYFVAGSN
jgi:Tol biopolymer transport system component